MSRPRPTSTPFPSTTLFRSFVITGRDLPMDASYARIWKERREPMALESSVPGVFAAGDIRASSMNRVASAVGERSEEHTSELQSQSKLVCRLLLEKKKQQLSEELQPAPTERAEHLLLVDLARPAVGRVGLPGSIDVSEFLRLVSYAHV